MLQYKIFKSCFFTDTFFVANKAKITRGFLCIKAFVSYKGYVKIYPMKWPSGFMASLKYFAKEVGAPEILVANPHPS